MTLTGFEEFIRQRRDVLFPLLHNVQEVFQEKTLGKGRWKEIRQARLSKSDDDFMGPDVYMDHVMNKHKVFRGAYKILRKKQVEEVQKGINRTAVYASKAGPSAPNMYVYHYYFGPLLSSRCVVLYRQLRQRLLGCCARTNRRHSPLRASRFSVSYVFSCASMTPYSFVQRLAQCR